MQDIEVKVYRSSLKIPVAFFVPGAFLVTVYAVLYLFLNSNIFAAALVEKLDDLLPGSVSTAEIVIAPSLVEVRLYDTHVYSPEGVEVIRAEKVHAFLSPLMLLTRRIDIHDAYVTRGGVHMTMPEYSDQTFDLLRALGVDEPADPNDTGESFLREIRFRNIRCDQCFYSLNLGFFRVEVPEVNVPYADVSLADITTISVSSLDIDAVDLKFQSRLFGFPEDQGPWEFTATDVKIRDWQWINDGFLVDSVSLTADGVDASATGTLHFPSSEDPDAETQMLYRAAGTIHIPMQTKLGDYFLDQVLHADVSANLAVRGSLDEIEGALVAKAPYLETQGVRFQNMEARGVLLDDIVLIDQATADLHAGSVSITHGVFSMFEGIYAAEVGFEGVDPEGVLRDLKFDYPWMSGSARGDVTLMGWLPLSPEFEEPGDDPYAWIDAATKPVAWVRLNSDVAVTRKSREVLPGGRIRVLAGGEVAMSLDTADISKLSAVFDHVTGTISNFHYNWETNQLESGPHETPAVVSLVSSDLGGFAGDYGFAGVGGKMDGEIRALGAMNYPSADGRLRLRAPSLTVDGVTIFSDDVDTTFSIRNGRLNFTPVTIKTPQGGLKLEGSVALLKDPEGVMDPTTGKQTSAFLLPRSNDARMDFTLSNLDLAIVDRFAKTGLGLKGRMDAMGHLFGAVTNPTVDVNASLNGGEVAGQPLRQAIFDGVASSSNVEARAFVIDAGDAGKIEGRGVYNLRQDFVDFAVNGSNVVFESLKPLAAFVPVSVKGTGQIEIHGSGSVEHPQIAGHALIDGFEVDGRKLGDASLVANTLSDTVYLVGALAPLATIAMEIPMDAESPYYVQLGLDHLNLKNVLSELSSSPLVDRLEVTGKVEAFAERDFSRYQVLATLDQFALDTLNRTFTNKGPIIAGLNDGNLIQIQQAEVGAQGRYVMIQGGIFLDEALLDVSLAGSLDMALVNSFRASFPEYFPDAVIDAKGVVELDTNLRGTPGGNIVADGFLRFLPTEIQLRDLPEPVVVNSGVITFGHQGLTIDPQQPIRGRALQGMFELGGSLGISGFEARDLRLDLHAVNMSYRIPGVANATFGGNIRLDAPQLDRPDTWNLSGLIDVVDGLYYQNISIFQEQFTNRILGAFSRESDAYQASLVERFPILEDVNLDLNIRARDSFRIQSEIDRLGLDLELRLDVKLQSTLAQPRLLGEVDVIDGRVKFQDEKFEVRSGTLTFSGEVKNPYVDIIADADVNNRCRQTDLGDDSRTTFNLSGDTSSSEQQVFRIILNVRGKLSNLDIQLESNPYADQRDILSLILTGCTVDQITASSASSPTLEVALAPVLGWIEGTVQQAVSVEEFTITPSVDRLRTSIGDRLSRRLSWRLQVDTGLANSSSGQLYQLNYKLSDAWAAELSESTRTEDDSFIIDFKLKYRIFLD